MLISSYSDGGEGEELFTLLYVYDLITVTSGENRVRNSTVI